MARPAPGSSRPAVEKGGRELRPAAGACGESPCFARGGRFVPFVLLPSPHKTSLSRATSALALILCVLSRPAGVGWGCTKTDKLERHWLVVNNLSSYLDLIPV